MSDITCDSCGGPIPLKWERCPHCARPGLFPNVRAAREAAPDLDQRYRAALQEASSRGAESAVAAFEAAVRASNAVITRPLRDVNRLASSDRELISTYYKLTEGEVQLPSGDKWDRLRRIADEHLFPGYKEHIRFAALSLDESGLSEYGECSLVLRDDMIDHRASVFEENSAVFLERYHYQEPPGCRASWEERTKLCTAKHAGEIDPAATSDEFTRILLRQGATPEESRFVEVHVWGPMSLRTIERAILRTDLEKPRRPFVEELRENLAKMDKVLEVV